MKYRLVVVEPAERDVHGVYSYILARSTQGAMAWYRAFVTCTEEIIQHPLAFPVALENNDFDIDLRQALFKTTHGDPYRCVFTVTDDEVRILRIRGRGQPPLNPSDIRER